MNTATDAIGNLVGSKVLCKFSPTTSKADKPVKKTMFKTSKLLMNFQSSSADRVRENIAIKNQACIKTVKH